MFCSRCWMISKLFLESITSFSLCLLASLTAALILRTWNVLLWNILLFIQKLILRTSAAAKAFTSFTISPTSTFLCFVLSDIWAVKKTPRIHPMSQQKSKWQKQRLSRRANNYIYLCRCCNWDVNHCVVKNHVSYSDVSKLSAMEVQCNCPPYQVWTSANSISQWNCRCISWGTFNERKSLRSII